jgi:hypothetical protein
LLFQGVSERETETEGGEQGFGKAFDLAPGILNQIGNLVGWIFTVKYNVLKSINILIDKQTIFIFAV